MKTRYDVIVIGGGVNELVAATYLAKAGRAVLVVEPGETVGGVLVTREVFPGFAVDVCAHDLGWLDAQMVRDLDLASHGLDILGVESSLLIPGQDGRSLSLRADAAEAVRSIAEFSPADAAKWPAFLERVASLAGFLQTLYRVPPPLPTSRDRRDLRALLALGRRFRGLGKVGMLEFLRTLPMSVADMLDDWFEGDLLKGALGAGGVAHLDQGPRSAGTAFLLLHREAGRPPGALRTRTIVRGGVGQVARALANALTGRGGEVRLGAAIAGILVESGAATGVVLAGGEEISASTIVSGADPRRTFLEHLDPDHLDPEFIRAVQNIKFNGVAAKVNLALDALPSFAPAPGQPDGRLLRGTVSVSPSLEYLERAYDDAKYGRPSRRPTLEVTIPSLLDAGLAPEGKHVMSVWMQYAPYTLHQNTWNASARDALGQLVVDTLADYAPNLPGSILDRQVLTPADLEAEFGLSEGHLYQGHLTLDQILFMRPVPGWSGYRTPIDGLYLSGACTHPAGLAGGPGRLAAMRVLADRKRATRRPAGLRR